jgi:signal peptidase II
MRLKHHFFWVAAVVSVLLDQLTKYWVVQNFELSETRPLWPGVFHFTYVTNTGAAFSLFSEGGGWLRWLSSGRDSTASSSSATALSSAAH